MMEPTVWMQLGISEARYTVTQREIDSILKTKETIGNMMLMVKDNQKLSYDEKYYAAFAISKEQTQRKLMNALPALGKGMIKKILMEED